MTESKRRPVAPRSVGPLLQHWRRTRNLSQLALAHQAAVSPRHVSFIETGRSSPSRDMVLHLAEALAVPLRERNALLMAAGFAPMFRESRLDDASLAPVRAAVDAILAQQEPYPAVVMNRTWDILATNGAATRFFDRLLGGRKSAGTPNVLRLMFDPEALRRHVIDWEVTAQVLLQRVHREAVGGVVDDALRALVDEVCAFPGVPRAWKQPDHAAVVLPIIPVTFDLDGERFRYFSAVTVLGTSHDITVQELRIETFFPLDAETTRAAIQLSSRSGEAENRDPGSFRHAKL
jgi:transcriptional regulator with XRE-family HTH domain